MNGKKIFSRILVAVITGVLLMCPVLAASTFPDVDENAAYAEAAGYLNEIGVMQGDTQGNFNPERNVTRAQMAAIICRMLGENESISADVSGFTDVPTSYWAYNNIMMATSLGIINGYNDGSFRPDNTVSYEQAVTMTVRALGYENEADSAGGYPDGYLLMGQNIGLLNGITLANGAPLDRKSVAIIIYNSYHSYV